MILFDESKGTVLYKYYHKPATSCYSEENLFINEKTDFDLSIIIPCYNSEKYLKECLDSVVAQNYPCSYEIIIINDGSQDDTEIIIASYFEKNQAIRMISQENRGFSGARNRGISESKGRYLMFIDSDDRISAGYVKSLMCAAKEKNADIVACGYQSFRNNTVYKYVSPSGGNDKRFLNGFFWGKVFKREFFEHIKLPEGLWYEDSILPYLIYPKVKKFITVNDCYYGYRSNPQGITISSRGKLKAIDTFYITDLMIDTVTAMYGKDAIHTTEFNELLLEQFYLNQRRIIQLPKEVRKEIFKFQSDYAKKYLRDFHSRQWDRKGYLNSLKSSKFITSEIHVRADKCFKIIGKLKK